MDNATPHGYEQSPTPYIPATPYLQITHACRGCSGSPHSVRLAETIANADATPTGLTNVANEVGHNRLMRNHQRREQ